MALKLIRRGPETIRLTTSPGAGRQATYRSGEYYPLRGYGWVQLTVTATNCGGVNVQDRENGYSSENREGGPVASITGIFLADRYGPVVSVLDPTDKTEVIMHVVPIPPPCLIAGLRAWWGGCRGADTNRHHPRRGGVHVHRRNRVAHPHRQKPNLGDSRDNRCNTRTGHLPYRGATERRAVQPFTVGERGQHHNPGGGGVFRGEATVLRAQWSVENHPTVATALCGGGARSWH